MPAHVVAKYPKLRRRAPGLNREMVGLKIGHARACRSEVPETFFRKPESVRPTRKNQFRENSREQVREELSLLKERNGCVREADQRTASDSPLTEFTASGRTAHPLRSFRRDSSSRTCSLEFS